MASATAPDLCRITLVAPDRSAELAVPAGVSLADMLPALLHQLGEELAERGLADDGWVLQRLGAPPLDEDQTPASLGLRDGETLYLRPRNGQLPVPDFDDLVDGIASGVRGLPDRWRPSFTRRLLLALALAALAVGLVPLSAYGAPGTRAITATAVAAALLLGTLVASRAAGDAAVGSVLGTGALGYAAMGGLLASQLVGQRAAAASVDLLQGLGLLMSGAAIAAGASLCLAAVGGIPAPFVAATAVGVLTALGGLLTVSTSLSGPQAAGIVAAVALAASTAAPITAFRLAGLRIPALPTGADNLDEDIDPLPGQRLLERTRAANAYLTALHAALGVVATGCLATLATDRRWAPTTVAAIVCALLALRSRGLVGAWQRAALLLPATAGTAALVLASTSQASALTQVVFVPAGLALTAGLFVVAAVTLPGRRLVPHWGRAADIGESLLAAALIPIILALLGVYGAARGVGG